jgi:probable F420-dependent oxidoreductase
VHRMKFGLFLPPHDYGAAKETALRAEREGFHSVAFNDHFVAQTGPPGTPQLECLTVLSAVAAVTDHIRLTPTVLSASYRPPAILAKMAATLDQVSEGRLIMGLGAGWHQDEYRAHGYPFPPTETRMEQLAETIAVLKAMWTEEDPCFLGKHFSVEHGSSQPRPIQQPYPPIMLGGSSRGLLSVAAREANIVNLIPPTSDGRDFLNDQAKVLRFDRSRLQQRIGVLRELCDEIGRDPADIELGGLVVLNTSRDPNSPAFAKLAKRLGYSDHDAARGSPVALIGTPEQIVEELEDRMALGITYLILVPTTPSSEELFVREVMPAFAR